MCFGRAHGVGICDIKENVLPHSQPLGRWVSEFPVGTGANQENENLGCFSSSFRFGPPLVYTAPGVLSGASTSPCEFVTHFNNHPPSQTLPYCGRLYLVAPVRRQFPHPASASLNGVNPGSDYRGDPSALSLSEDRQPVVLFFICKGIVMRVRG